MYKKLSVNTVLKLAIEAHRAGKAREADKYYTAILKAQPTHPDANHNMGVLSVSIGKAEKALPFFEMAIKANPNVEQFWISYIDTLLKQERMDDAKATFALAKEKGLKKNVLIKIEKEIEKLSQSLVPDSIKSEEVNVGNVNILEELSLNQALKLAVKKSDEGSVEASKKIYIDILEKYPGNKKARVAIKLLSAGLRNKIKSIKQPTQDELEVVKLLIEQSNFEKLQEEVIELQKNYPTSEVLFNILGFAKKNLGQVDAALEAYEVATKINPKYAQAYNNLGTIFKAKGNLERAEEAYEKAYSLKPDFSEAFYNNGILFKEKENFSKAIALFSKAIAINPNFAAAYSNLGTALLQKGEIEEALKAFARAIEIDDGNGQYYNNLGNALKLLGKFDEAINAYKRAIALETYDKEIIYNNLGNALSEINLLTDAIAAYLKAIEIDQGYADAFNNMGIVLNQQGKFEEALAACKKAVSLKPEFAEAFMHMGIIFKEQGKYKEAIAACGTALDLKPDFPDFLVNMGVILKEKGESKEAIKILKKALFIEPDLAVAHNNIGNIHRENDNIGEALKSYKKAISIKPDYAEAYSNLGLVEQKKGNNHDANKAFRRALEIAPNFPAAYNNIGNVMYSTGELNGAFESFNRCIELESPNLEPVENLLILTTQLAEQIMTPTKFFKLKQKDLESVLSIRPIYQLTSAINSFIMGDLNGSKRYIKNFESIESEHLHKLKPKQKKFCSAYHGYLSKLLNDFTLSKYQNDSELNVYHIGESHCLSYAHRQISFGTGLFRIKPLITFGAKAFHFTKKDQNNFKEITKRNFLSIPKNSNVFISFGEIDCRENEGFIQAASKLRKPINELISDTVDGFLQWFVQNNKFKGHALYFFNVPAPRYNKKIPKEVNMMVRNTVRIFNGQLENELAKYKFSLIDTYGFTAGHNKFSNELFHLDERHLGIKALPQIEQQIIK